MMRQVSMTPPESDELVLQFVNDETGEPEQWMFGRDEAKRFLFACLRFVAPTMDELLTLYQRAEDINARCEEIQAEYWDMSPCGRKGLDK